jgi:hypothetical protein
MQCIKIADRISVLDIVSLLGERGVSSLWRAKKVWTVQEGDDSAFEEKCNSGAWFTGVEFIAALKPVSQVIDGYFQAFDSIESAPWATIKAVDSSFHLFSADPEGIARAEASFEFVTAYDNDGIA